MGRLPEQDVPKIKITISLRKIQFVDQDLQTVSALFKETYGVDRAAEIAADFPALLEKWYGLVADIESKEQLQQLYWDQVISKIDPATYGQ